MTHMTFSSPGLRIKVFGALFVLFMVAVPAFGASLSGEEERSRVQADAAYETGNYAYALTLYTPLAEEGDGHAQAMLSRLYAGQPGQAGVPRDEARALKWAQTGADQGHPDAMLALAALYYTGVGVEKDLSKAGEIVERAASKGDATAQAHLGMMYSQGDGRPRDLGMAKDWLMKAARQGQWNAQIMLGRLILNEGTMLGASLPAPNVPVEDASLAPPVEADRAAARRGDAAAQLRLSRALYIAALREATDVPHEAVDLMEQAAESGNQSAQWALGALLSDGSHGIPSDPPTAKAWFDKALKQ